jgi:hypothetical protein
MLHLNVIWFPAVKLYLQRIQTNVSDECGIAVYVRSCTQFQTSLPFHFFFIYLTGEFVGYRLCITITHESRKFPKPPKCSICCKSPYTQPFQNKLPDISIKIKNIEDKWQPLKLLSLFINLYMHMP